MAKEKQESEKDIQSCKKMKKMKWKQQLKSELKKKKKKEKKIYEETEIDEGIKSIRKR